MKKKAEKTAGIPVETTGTLKDGEFHPAALGAFHSIKQCSPEKLARWQESLASTALSGNRLAEICSETLDRILDGVLVSDRYLLGLAWVMREDLE